MADVFASFSACAAGQYMVSNRRLSREATKDAKGGVGTGAKRLRYIVAARLPRRGIMGVGRRRRHRGQRPRLRKRCEGEKVWRCEGATVAPVARGKTFVWVRVLVAMNGRGFTDCLGLFSSGAAATARGWCLDSDSVASVSALSVLCDAWFYPMPSAVARGYGGRVCWINPGSPGSAPPAATSEKYEGEKVWRCEGATVAPVARGKTFVWVRVWWRWMVAGLLTTSDCSQAVQQPRHVGDASTPTLWPPCRSSVSSVTPGFIWCLPPSPEAMADVSA